MRPRLLDLFCGAGGCSVGYHRAGFDVVGVDIEYHADYPFPHAVYDAREVLAEPSLLGAFDVIHASPPCQRWSTATGHGEKHPDLLTPIRPLLKAWGGLYVIENVPLAPLDQPVMLCGKAFGLGVRRHRYFESNVFLMSPGCACDDSSPVGVYGDHPDGKVHRRPDGTSRGTKARTLAEGQAAMGIDWMTEWDDLTDAIPPSYCEHIGAQLIDALKAVA